MKNRKLFFKRFVMGIVIFFMAVFELQMIWGSVYISKTVTKERRNSYASALEIYSSNLEQQLKQIDDFLLQSVMIENDARSILESTTELNQYLAEVRMRDTFDEELSQLKMLSGVMWYGKTANVTKKVIRMRRGQNNASVISKWIAANTEGLLKKVKENAYVDWFVYEVEGSQILVRILNNRETYMIGWLDISQIFQEFEKTLSDVKEEKIFLKAGNETAFQDKIQSDKIETEKGYQIIEPQNSHQVALCLALKQNGFYQKMTNLSIVVPLVLIVSGILIMLFSFVMAKYFIRPMDDLRNAMIKMQEGDLEVRLNQQNLFYEFQLLNRNFDRMAEKIKELKIEVYENQLEKQNVEMQYLKHQIKPHFLTNCLNTIKNLLFLEEYEKAEQFTLLLGKNIRYDLSEKTEVTLDEEINHIKNYIALSEIRYGNQLKLHLDIQETLFECKIPAMLIQTFVENSVKHEMSPEEVLHIWVKVWEEKERLHITVEDSGQGFEEEILEKLKNGESVMHNGMEHFGISNVKRRLNIIYGDAAEIHFSNEENRAKENKAKVTIELPASEDLNRAKAEIKLPANKGLNKTNAEIDLSANKGLNKIEFFAEQAEWNNIDKNECDDTSRQLAIKGEEADESESEKKNQNWNQPFMCNYSFNWLPYYAQ